MTIRRPVLRFHGGKFRLAKKIITHFPPHKVYVEPFGGAASILMLKERSYAEVYNDAWGEVVNVFRVLRDPEQAKELERLLRLTPYSRQELGNCREKVGRPVERARRLIFSSFASFGNDFSNTFRKDTRRQGGTSARDWQRYPEAIRTFTDRLQGVIIEQGSFRDVIRDHDAPGTLIFADPPYPHRSRGSERKSTRSIHRYAHEMTDDDHRSLADVLHSIKGMIIISSYHSDLYDQELYPDWRQVEIKTHADGARPRTEVLYFSPNCPEIA
jgi:DNA adenine methylase